MLNTQEKAQELIKSIEIMLKTVPSGSTDNYSMGFRVGLKLAKISAEAWFKEELAAVESEVVNA